jgi:hypothetical protein
MEDKRISEMTDAEMREEVRFWARSFAYAKGRARGLTQGEAEWFADLTWKTFKRKAVDFLVLRELHRAAKEEAQWN